MTAAHLRKRRPKPHAVRNLDQVCLKIDGRFSMARSRRRGRGSRVEELDRSIEHRSGQRRKSDLRWLRACVEDQIADEQLLAK
jgi:hypothetical protein